MDHKFIYIIHLLFVAPLLIYSGYVGRNLTNINNNKNKIVFEFLMAVGIIVLLYHAYKLFKYY